MPQAFSLGGFCRADRLDRGDRGWVSVLFRMLSCSVGFGLTLSFDTEVSASADDVKSSFLETLARPRFTLGFKVCAVTSRLSVFLLRFLPDSYQFKVRDRGGMAELVFRRAAYVPLSRIKPSRSFVSCRERFHSAVVAVLTALIVMIVFGSVFSSGCFG
ncbi:hypothetical protein F2Q69_00004803 [Brassica cretica]|uniref:Transmembrane protein n=1 Tax=Brassica cretica TaxID=69181 RepID=A0A8S9PFC9_BRACR|nr:hypothetical protein F2Q69_00004803 [Brassica cretica]